MKKNDDEKSKCIGETVFFNSRTASEPNKKNRRLDRPAQILDEDMTFTTIKINDFKNFIEHNTQDKSIVNILLAITEPLFASYPSHQDHLNASQKIKKVLSVYINFDTNRVSIREQIQSMQKLALSNPSEIDKSTLDYSCAMNSLCTKFEIKEERSPTKKAVESAYAYVASFCITLERRMQNENLETLYELSPK